MEIKQVTPEMREKLRAPLPNEAVSKHPTKTYLSSIKGIYVIERLNDVFGIGSFKIKTKEISCNNGVAVVKVKLSIPDYGIELESYGGNDNGGQNSKNFDLGDAYKGAATDAITKICSWLEIGIGVFKGQGNVPQQIKTKEQAQPAAEAQALDKEKLVEKYLKGLNHELVTDVEKKKALLTVHTLTEEQLKEKITNLGQLIRNRQNKNG